jgi:hypothetical protein
MSRLKLLQNALMNGISKLHMSNNICEVPKILDKIIERLNQTKDSLDRTGFTPHHVLAVYSIEPELRELTRQTEEGNDIIKIVAQQEKNFFWNSLNSPEYDLKRFNNKLAIIAARENPLEDEQILNVMRKKLQTKVGETAGLLVERRKKLQDEVLLSQND